jgi:hypothetical protein
MTATGSRATPPYPENKARSIAGVAGIVAGSFRQCCNYNIFMLHLQHHYVVITT